MAITWGTKQTATRRNADGSAGTVLGFRIGYEVSRSGKTMTVNFYINTRYSVDDAKNTFIASLTGPDDTKLDSYSGNVTILTTGDSGEGWGDTNTQLIKSLETTSTGTISISASLTKIELGHHKDNGDSVGTSKTATVSGSVTNYTTHTANPINPTVTFLNDGKSFRISGRHGAGGTNNNLYQTNVFFTINGVDPNSESNYTACKSFTSLTASNNEGWYSFDVTKDNVKNFFASSYDDTAYQLMSNNSYTTVKVHVYSYFRATTSSVRAAHISKVGTGTITSIRDNGDNSYTVFGSRGADGAGNSVSSASLWWTHTKSNGNWTWTDNDKVLFTSGSDKCSKTIYFTPTSDNATNRAVAGAVVTVGALGDKTDSGWKTSEVKQYFKPYKPGSPVISYTKRKLTLREDWVYNWTSGGTPNSTTSPVTGYRIMIYKNGSLIEGLQCNGDRISKGSAVTLDRQGTSTKIIFNPKDLGFGVGDTVFVAVRAYTTWGDDTKQYSDTAQSAESTVQKAGIVRVKTSECGWTEGQVWVKVSGEWKEADSVKVNVKGNWKDSE